jgi:dTDP-4-dehydrorhamnose reductase
MLGQALLAEAGGRRVRAAGAARSGADYTCDLGDASAVTALIADLKPRLVINAAAMTDLNACETDPGSAYRINGRAVALLAQACRSSGCRLVHVSTDHFFTGDHDALHDEVAPIQLVNDYARSKFAGEAFALALPGALVLRTNITGFRGWAGRPTFAEWLIEAIERDEELTLFEDYWTSTIDAGSFARATLDLAASEVAGLLNLASRSVVNKRMFAEALARGLGLTLTRSAPGYVANLAVRRAESAGLDVSMAEVILGRKLPDLDDVIAALVSEYKSRCVTTPAS